MPSTVEKTNARPARAVRRRLPTHPGVDPRTRERAIERYIRDEQQALSRGRDTPARRHIVLSAVMLRWVAKWITKMHTEVVHKGKRGDEAVVEAICFGVARVYSMSTRFALAHILGPVSKRFYRARLATCGDCTYRRVDDYGHAHCYGAQQGKGCGCWEHPWWPFSRLGWKLALRNYVCPIGQFGRLKHGDETLGTESAGNGPGEPCDAC